VNHSPANNSLTAFETRARGRFEGLANVVRFNWPLYVSGLAIALAALAAGIVFHLPAGPRIIVIVAACAALYLLAASLLASHWIYDRSSLYRFEWAKRFAGDPPRHILNVHTGFDESSPSLRSVFPMAEMEILELHDPARMTEPSIARARRYQARIAPRWLAELTQRIPPGPLPYRDSSFDAVFAVLALHEIRNSEDRSQLFGEFNRTLCPGGRLVLLEHLRDLPNFLVFGPQFVHFYSGSTWLNHAAGAGLKLVHKTRITPFVGVFTFEKAQAGTV